VITTGGGVADAALRNVSRRGFLFHLSRMLFQRSRFLLALTITWRRARRIDTPALTLPCDQAGRSC
jgi:hypothetical protein